MKQFIKNSFTLLLLCLFIAPQVNKGLHDFEHRNDFHCDAKGEKHLHQLEHSCTLCDYVFASADQLPSKPDSVVLVQGNFSFTAFLPTKVSTLNTAYLPSRAPPVC